MSSLELFVYVTLRTASSDAPRKLFWDSRVVVRPRIPADAEDANARNVATTTNIDITPLRPH